MPKAKQQQELVVSQFESQMDIYTAHGSGAEAAAIGDLVTILLEKSSQSRVKTLKICEFGGGNGAALSEVARQYKQKSKRKKNAKQLQLINAELVQAYERHQVSKDIDFQHTSILDSGFADSSFDLVYSRHVYHHLISPTLVETRENQRMAVQEMLRVVKPGGMVVIEEQTNQSEISNQIIFYASMFATKAKLNIHVLQITEHTKIGYLTHQQLLQLLQDARVRAKKPKKGRAKKFAFTIRSERNEQWNQPWWMKYPLLLWNNGASVIVAEKVVE